MINICDWCLRDRSGERLRPAQVEPDKSVTAKNGMKVVLPGRKINVCAECTPAVARQMALARGEKEGKNT